MKRILVFLPVLAVLLFATACVGPKVRPPEGVVPRPEALSSEEWNSRLASRAETWHRFQANLRIKAESPKGKASLRAIVVAVLPDRVRLEAFNPWGQTVALLLLDKGDSSLWVPSENVVYTARRAE